MSYHFSGRLRTFLFLGAPGSGKGTAGRALGSVPRFYHMACGDVFRQLDTRTPLGQEFIKWSSQGKLVPDEVTIRLWKATLQSRIDTHQYKPSIDFLVLDGIPRNVYQARMLEDSLDVLQVFHLGCPDRVKLAERLRKRALKDNRLDDASDEVIARRIKTYEDESRPLLAYYPQEIICPIDAQQPPAVVISAILSRVITLPVWRKVNEYDG